MVAPTIYKTISFFVLSCSLASASPFPSTLSQIQPTSPLILAPLITPPPPPTADATVVVPARRHDSHIVPDSYLVVLEDHLDDDLVEAHCAHADHLHRHATSSSRSSDLFPGASGVIHKFSLGGKRLRGQSFAGSKRRVHGYTGTFTEEAIDAIRGLKGVKYVERNSIVTASEVQKGAPWGLARLSHRSPLSFGTFNRYEYDGEGGEGVDTYVIDTGINIDHLEFEGRASWGKTIPKDVDLDSNGHGTHVAGTMVSAKYGVAKKARVIAVKVLGAGGSGTMADVVGGVSWAAEAAYAKSKKKGYKGSVANMSLGGGKSPTLDEAVDAAVEDGLHFAVAAGNDNKDACAYSPAASKLAITVAASTIADERAYFSNHGPCVDVFAPGLNILSTWNTNNVSINTISGTSMASPHVAGLMAYFLSIYPQAFNPESEDFIEAAYERLRSSSSTPYSYSFSAQFVFNKVSELWSAATRSSSVDQASVAPISAAALKKAVLKAATKNVITGDLPAGTPNLLIYNQFTEDQKKKDQWRME